MSGILDTVQQQLTPDTINHPALLSARSQRLREFSREAARDHSPRRSIHVVLHTHLLDDDFIAADVDDCVTGAPIAVFRTPDRAGVYEVNSVH